MRLLSIITTVMAFAFSVSTVYSSHKTIELSQGKIYVIQGGELKEAISEERKQYLNIEMEDHVKNFHKLFFSLEPDEQFNRENLVSALYLADETAKQQYDNLKESGYYNDVVAGNVSQKVLKPDSIQVLSNTQPYRFRYYGKLQIVRATSKVTRSLITEGTLRLSEISRNNPHGLLIEHWKILANNDLSIEKR